MLVYKIQPSIYNFSFLEILDFCKDSGYIIPKDMVQ